MFRAVRHYVRSNAVAFVALFIALGGSSYAATSLPRNSVTTKQLKDGSVTYAKLGRDARQKLIAAAVAGPQGRAGPQGPQGPAGKDGTTATAPAGDVIIRRATAPVAYGQTADLYIACLPGERAVSGGGRLGLYGAGSLSYSFPVSTGRDSTTPSDEPAVGWDVGVYNGTGFPQTAYGFAACARP